MRPATSVRFRLIVSVSVLSLIISSCVGAFGDGTHRRVDALFAEWDRTDSPGAAVAILRNGNVEYSKGFGRANLEYPVFISPSTIFHVASVSKQFTVFSILLLQEQGKLNLDDEVRLYISEMPAFDGKITIRHLIHHTSGIRDQWELLAMAGWRLDDVITREQILKMLANQEELNFMPGEQSLYSNMGYTLLAEIVARVSGMTFPEWTDQNLFRPLGMNKTHFHDSHEHIVPDRAYSYAPIPGGGYRHAVLSYANAGATSLFTTAEDMMKWLRNFDNPVVGSLDIIDRMHERGVLINGDTIQYAGALITGEYKGASIVSHGGADAGFRSFVVRFPEHDLGIVVLSNLRSFSPQTIAMQIADIYLNDKLIETGEKSIAVGQMDLSTLHSYEGVYRMESGTVLTVKLERDSLWMQPFGQGRLFLIPVGEGRFSVREPEIGVEFIRDESSSGFGIQISVGGTKNHGRYIAAGVDLSPELNEYTGTYFSRELETFYSLELADGRLVARHRRHNDILLSPVTQDLCVGDAWWFRTLDFVRGEDGSIAGFRLTGGRVRNLLFMKM